MIKYREGDILDSGFDIICQSVNHQGVMGSGLAKQIVKKYPDIINENRMYKEMCRSFSYGKIKRNGLVAWHEIGDGQYIASIFGQDKYGRDKKYTDYVALGNGIEYVAQFAESKNKSIAIPFGIGCGLGGGDWIVVLDIIENCFRYYPEVPVSIFKIAP